MAFCRQVERQPFVSLLITEMIPNKTIWMHHREHQRLYCGLCWLFYEDSCPTVLYYIRLLISCANIVRRCWKCRRNSREKATTGLSDFHVAGQPARLAWNIMSIHAAISKAKRCANSRHNQMSDAYKFTTHPFASVWHFYLYKSLAICKNVIRTCKCQALSTHPNFLCYLSDESNADATLLLDLHETGVAVNDFSLAQTVNGEIEM